MFLGFFMSLIKVSNSYIVSILNVIQEFRLHPCTYYLLFGQKSKIRSGGSISLSVKSKAQVSAIGNGFAPVKLLNAIPLPPFSAVLNSAPLRKSPPYALFLRLPGTCIPCQSRAQYSSTVFRLFLRQIPLKEGSTAKPSMVASTIPKNPVYHESKDTSRNRIIFDLWGILL
jgi:hypothetical protein